MERQVDLLKTKCIFFENSMIMFGVYNAETVEKIVTTIQTIHNKRKWNERLFSARLSSWYNWYLSKQGVVYYAIYSFLYLNTLKEK